MSYFPTTHWSLVLSVGHGTAETARQSLEQLFRTYWYPLYAFARAQGEGSHDAEDLIQSFFVELIERNTIAKAREERGRFRSFLLQSFKHHRHNQRARAAAQKRGGASILSLDELRAEERFANEPQDTLSPESRFDRDWAVSVLDEAHRRLAAEYGGANKGALFARLSPLLQGEQESRYAGLAADFGKTESAIKMEVSRLRSRYRELLRAVVADTVDSPTEVEEELRYLLTAASS